MTCDSITYSAVRDVSAQRVVFTGAPSEARKVRRWFSELH